MQRAVKFPSSTKLLHFASTCCLLLSFCIQWRLGPFTYLPNITQRRCLTQGNLIMLNLHLVWFSVNPFIRFSALFHELMKHALLCPPMTHIIFLNVLYSFTIMKHLWNQLLIFIWWEHFKTNRFSVIQPSNVKIYWPLWIFELNLILHVWEKGKKVLYDMTCVVLANKI